ncbi:hypothetical protein PN490_10585, partial [Nodularia spumigena CS-588/01]|nr:hypothetical protein [Nodularia spumigena CS-588/01]
MPSWVEQSVTKPTFRPKKQALLNQSIKCQKHLYFSFFLSAPLRLCVTPIHITIKRNPMKKSIILITTLLLLPIPTTAIEKTPNTPP